MRLWIWMFMYRLLGILHGTLDKTDLFQFRSSNTLRSYPIWAKSIHCCILELLQLCVLYVPRADCLDFEGRSGLSYLLSHQEAKEFEDALSKTVTWLEKAEIAW